MDLLPIRVQEDHIGPQETNDIIHLLNDKIC